MALELIHIQIEAAEYVDLIVQDGGIYPDTLQDRPGGQVARPAQTPSMFSDRLSLFDSSDGIYRPAACTGLSLLFFYFRHSSSVDKTNIHSRWKFSFPPDQAQYSWAYAQTTVGGYDNSLRIDVRLNGSPFVPAQILTTLTMTMTDLLDSSGSSQTWSVPIELYILPNTLSDYFEVESMKKKLVPLLFLRMFVGAASRQRIASEKDWVALVTRICHGSAEPFTGNTVSTKDHWLKYEATAGASSFVRANSTVSPFNNYGGDFLLSAWLWAYRIWKAKNVITLVNCYDQAGIVEVALSLGMDPDKVAWEYHKPYGFINDAGNASLVGWGPCNSPYFMGDKQGRGPMVGQFDATRTYFTNHAFLVWSPGQPPLQHYEDKATRIPPLSENSEAFAIDACAGPHVGNERRGIWEQPWKIETGKGSTYSGMRDTAHDKRFDEAHWNREHGPDAKQILNHHGCTVGITRVTSNKAAPSIYLPIQDPLKDVWEKVAPPLPSKDDNWPFPKNSVWNGSTTELLKDFEDNNHQYSGESQKWEAIPIADVEVDQGVTCREIKVYEPSHPRLRYYSVRISEFASYGDARQYLRACTSFALLTSTATAAALRSREHATDGHEGSKPGKGYSLQLDLLYLLCYNNILVEINGRADQEKFDRVAAKMTDNIISKSWRIRN